MFYRRDYWKYTDIRSSFDKIAMSTEEGPVKDNGQYPGILPEFQDTGRVLYSICMISLAQGAAIDAPLLFRASFLRGVLGGLSNSFGPSSPGPI